MSRGHWPRLRSPLLRNSDVSKDADAREKCVNQACCQCGYSGEIGNGIDPINALQPFRRHLQLMDRTDLGQKAAQRLNMDRADSLLGLGKLFRDFSGHFGEFYHFHKVMCFYQLDSLPCAACKDLLDLSSGSWALVQTECSSEA